MAVDYRVISADSHLELDPGRWTPRVPAKYRERAPRRITLPDGGDGLVVEGRPLYVTGLAVTGTPYEEHSPSGICYEGSPGTGSPERRLEEQDRDGVDAEIMFTSTGSNPHFWRGIRDDPAYRSVIHAYNEFLAEEYCAAAPNRLVAMGVIPDTGIADAIAELEYCAQHGLKGIVLHAFPNGKTFPLAEDDKFYEAALALNMAVTVHVGIIIGDQPVFRYPKTPEGVSVRGDPV